MPLFGRRDEGERIPLVTTDGVAGYDVVAVVGFVSGLASDPEKALARLEEQAGEWEADAVVAVRLDSSASGGAIVSDRQCFAYGTAVRLRKRAA